MPRAASPSVGTSYASFYSSSLKRSLFYRVALPAGNYDRLPVLYLLHGANGNSSEMVRQLPIARFANDARLAIVLPDADTSYYTNAKHRFNARWEDAIVLDLARDVSKRLPVLSGPAHTGIAGISMGGYGAAKLALKHPGLFGFVGVVSGSLDITSRPANIHLLKQRWMIWMIFGFGKVARRDEDVFHLLRQTGQPPTDWFISCSRREPFYSFNERLARELKDRRVTVDFLPTAGGHDFESWTGAMTQLVNHAHGALGVLRPISSSNR